MSRTDIRTLWDEPRAPDPPKRVWRDWVLVSVLVVVAALEGLLRDDLAWRPFALVMGVALVFPLLWRRTHPLAVVAITFGVASVSSILTLATGDGPIGLNTMLYVVILLYSLLRWGSGREAVIGMILVLLAYVLGIASDYTGLGDAVAASIVLLFPAALGASVRYWTTSRVRTVEQVKLLEREQLARELHDTVAHHVSAIVVRAQAGQVLGTSDREAATAALKVIEHEAARTLAEMRSLVGALRDGEEADLAPQRGIADLSQLANSFLDGPPVAVELSGDLDDLSPSLDAAVYRIVQESITNAAQHARHATRVSVRVSGDDDSVRLAVRDNGDHPPSDRGKSGYGLIGMTERALLLGGVLTAGPLPGGGWSVDAALPKQASAR